MKQSHHPSDASAIPGPTSIESDLRLFTGKMSGAGASPVAISAFSNFYRQLRSGKRGLIPESAVTPLHSREIPSLNELSQYRKSGEQALPKTVVIKLNGGLGTTMGCNGPKSLIRVKNNLHFLDIAVHQLLCYSKSTGFTPPLILMNSFNTDEQSMAAMEPYNELPDTLPRSFLQNKFPRIDAETLKPVAWPRAPHLEWNPPGHGDIFTALRGSGLLEQLLEKKYRYAFVSNIDNLGASLNTALLGYLSSGTIGFLMEVTARTAMDRKGGHIARLKEGSLLLRESIQCPEDDLRYFQDIYRHRFFNTNNLWIDLAALEALLSASGGTLRLPLLCNRKFLDPSDPGSPVVYQLESAMGSALSLFSKTDAVSVPRSRFIPVKSCEDLLMLWSDFYTLSDEFRIIPFSEEVKKAPEIVLDSRFFGTVDQMTTRFEHGIPSLRRCKKLTIEGDVSFGKNVSIHGVVTISNGTQSSYRVPDNSILEDDLPTGR